MAPSLVAILGRLLELVSAGVVPVGDEIRGSSPSSPDVRQRRNRSWSQAERQRSPRKSAKRMTANKKTQTSRPSSPVKVPSPPQKSTTQQGTQTSRPSSPVKPTQSDTKEPTKSIAQDAKDVVKKGRVTKKWKWDNPRPTTSNTKGMSRFGKPFCYRTSLLQVLLHQPAFYHYLRTVHRGDEDCADKPVEECTVCAMLGLIQSYWCVPAGSNLLSGRLQSPDKALRTLNKALWHDMPEGHPLFEDFQGLKQSDPFELLQFLLDRYMWAEEREVIQKSKATKPDEQDEEPKSEPVRSTDLFDITMKRQWTCVDCGEVTTQDASAGEAGHGVGLEVDLQQPQLGLSLVQYLRANVFSEALDIKCEDGGCLGLGSAKPRERIQVITKAPEILVIRLVRFAQKFDRYGRREDFKITRRVPFEEYLSLGEFTENESPLVYRLDGVIGHSGTRMAVGHYIAGVRKQDGKTFCTINDDRAIETNRGGTVDELYHARSMVGSKQDFDPYILVYSKVQ